MAVDEDLPAWYCHLMVHLLLDVPWNLYRRYHVTKDQCKKHTKPIERAEYHTKKLTNPYRMCTASHYQWIA